MSRHTQGDEQVRLQMTPMIDVVFQLLIFFVLALKPQDLLSRLETNRPAARPGVAPLTQPVSVLIDEQGFLLEGSRATLPRIERNLAKLRSYTPNVSVVVRCTGDSQHSRLIQFLDTCAKLELKNISVFSL